jgi:alkylation response protein AidB-like acyl-CoA dehydrogenase
MDLAFTPAQEAFREEVRTWLAEHVPTERLASMDTPHGFAEHREWERVLAAGGWSVPQWPVEYGGRGIGVIEWLIYEEEYWAAGAPGRVSANGVSLLAPTIFEFGTPEQRQRFLPPMGTGEEIWAQGWSEPDAGSDLAALRTRAHRDGDHFVLNGQKTWCSRGAFADWIFCLVRTDPDAERHRGLSYLLVPADTPGLLRRPVGRLDGEPGFAELFFEDARVPVANLLGAEGQGWSVAMATASSERGLNLRAPGRFMAVAQRLIAHYRAHLTTAEPGARDDVVRGWLGAAAYRWLTYETASRLAAGGQLGPEASLMKIHWSELDVELHATALRLLGERGELLGDPWMDGYLFALAGPIYAGTNEIQRNIVAERVLGLPR